MPGNEKKIVEYLVQKKGKISLCHMGLVVSVGAPGVAKGKCFEINNIKDINRYLVTEDSKKKADIYINNHGVSLKQSGPTFSYNRLQRANLEEIFGLLGFKDSGLILARLDQEVMQFHKGKLEGRNRPWSNFFSEREFKALLKYLMTEGSPNEGYSIHPAEFILEAPCGNILECDIAIYTFEEYFNRYKDTFKIAIRRQWVGQASNSEHKRAKGLTKKPGNAPWVFNDVAGVPNLHRSGKIWRDDIPAKERKTVYFLMIEKEG